MAHRKRKRIKKTQNYLSKKHSLKFDCARKKFRETSVEYFKENMMAGALLKKQNHFLEHRIKLLRSGAIDADMLAETARANVGMYNKNDVIISIDLTKLKF